MSETKIGAGVNPNPPVNPRSGGDAGPQSVEPYPQQQKPGNPNPNSATRAGDHAANRQGRGNADGLVNKPARVREMESQAQHVRSKLDNPLPGAREGVRETVSKLLDGTGRLPEHAGRGEGNGNNHSQASRAYAGQSPNSQSPNGQSHGSHSQGSQSAQTPAGHSLHATTSPATDYLRGLTTGEELKPELRQVLDTAARLLGRDLGSQLRPQGHGPEKPLQFVERALAFVSRQLEKAPGAGGPRPAPLPESVPDGVREILEAVQLERYFDKLGKTGGDVVSRAEAALARALYGGATDGDGGFHTRVLPGEVLRDLRSGALLPPEESYNPFPLTGRARVVTEMMELMRALDAIERALQGRDARGEQAHGDGPDAALALYLKGYLGGEAALESLDELLSSLLPALPGRAARVELVRLMAALEGALVDAQGRLLALKDGTPLKLDGLLWLDMLGGALKSFAAESFPVRLSPLLLYGFDAIYSLIGFDGRTLNPPHFAAVQAQVNGSELEWIFGQPPLTEGWMRALIERLKDSASPDHNLLGEMLEEALADGRFHAVLVSGRVEEGEPVAGSFSVDRLLPGGSIDAAFSPA